MSVLVFVNSIKSNVSSKLSSQQQSAVSSRPSVHSSGSVLCSLLQFSILDLIKNTLGATENCASQVDRNAARTYIHKHKPSAKPSGRLTITLSTCLLGGYCYAVQRLRWRCERLKTIKLPYAVTGFVECVGCAKVVGCGMPHELVVVG